MKLRTIKNMLLMKDKYSLIVSLGLMKAEARLIFLYTSLEIGLFDLLTRPMSLDEIASALEINNIPLLSSLLDLGCSLKELSNKKGYYRVKGSMAKAIAKGSYCADWIREMVRYHANVAQRLGSLLHDGGKEDFMAGLGGVVARSSLMMEPLIKTFIHLAVKKTKALNILEIGCGSGVYLKYYADINPDNHGIAIDVNEEAANMAREFTVKNKIDKNFKVIHGNVLTSKSLENGSFDLITSFSNIYYFPEEEKARLLSKVLGLLKSGGEFIMATGLKSESLASSYLDLIFSATTGLYPLPKLEELLSALYAAGFTKVRTVNLYDRSFKGFIALN